MDKLENVSLHDAACCVPMLLKLTAWIQMSVTSAAWALSISAASLLESSMSLSLNSVFIASKQAERARKIAQSLEEMRAAGEYVSSLIQAVVWIALAETGAALDWFEIAVEEKAPWTPGIHAWPYFDPLRNESRFATLIRRVGLPPADTR